MTFQHFLDIKDIEIDALQQILARATKLKAALKKGDMPPLLQGKQLAMIFEKASTRTRVSFEVGINQLGGHAVVIDAATSQLGRGETIADTSRVLSRYADIIMLRTYSHDTLLEMAEYATIPVINGLTNHSHPCQVMADLLTLQEHRGAIAGKTVAWVGDFNNMTVSWIEAAEKLGFTLRIACPEALRLSDIFIPEGVTLYTDPVESVTGADLVTTDTWASMGDENAEEKMALLRPYRVNEALMQHAPDAVFMHCLPAHRGDEVTDAVMDGSQSVIFDEAENRLHVQKAIMLWCLGK